MARVDRADRRWSNAPGSGGTGGTPLLILRFGDRRLELDPRVLLSDGARVPVGRAAVRLLYQLAANRDRVVPTEELIRDVWQGAHVTPASVQQAVRSLRAALGEGDALVCTVRGLGYQLAPAVAVTEEGWGEHELPFVGRTAPLGRLSAGLEQTRAGRGGLVLISGPAGIGKTRLLRELEERAHRRGCLPLWSRCPEQGAATALWPWEEVLLALREADPAALEDQDPASRALLERAFPLLGSDAEARLDDLDPSALFRVYEAVRRVLVAAARKRPIAVAIDDLHRADEASLHVLEWIAARSANAGILLLAAYRQRAMRDDGALREVAARLLRLPGAGAEVLHELQRGDVEVATRAVLGGDLHDDVVDAFWRRSGGNPFLLKTLVHYARNEGTPAAFLALPPEANAAVRHHVADLSKPAQELLRQASVLGRHIDVDSLARLAEVPVAEALRALDEARAAGLVERAPREGLRFAHALVAEALHEELDEETRASLHARASELLEDDAQADVVALAERAEHAWRGASVLGPERAAACCERAAEAALRRYGFAEAARLYARACELAAEAPPQRRLGLLFSLGESRALAGQMEGATEALQQVVELARIEGDDEIHARAVLVLALMRGDETELPDMGWARMLEDALEAHRAETPLRANLLGRLAATLWRAPSFDRASSIAREAVALARRTGDPDALTCVLTRSYRILQTGWGDDAEMRGTARELSDVLERARDPLLALNGRITVLIDALFWGNRALFDAQVCGILEQAEVVGSPQAEWYALVARASRAQLTGDYALAEELAHRGLALGEASGIRVAAQNHTLQMFGIRWAQERLGELEPALASVATSPHHPLAWRVAAALAGLAAGRAGVARELLREFCAAPDQLARHMAYGGTLAMLAEIAAPLDDAAAAAILAPLLEPIRERHHAVSLGYCHMGAFERQLGRLFAVLERWDDAAFALESAVARDRRIGNPAFVARGQCDLARVLLRRGSRGDRTRAHALLAEARALARALGIERIVEA